MKTQRSLVSVFGMRLSQPLAIHCLEWYVQPLAPTGGREGQVVDCHIMSLPLA